MNNENILHKPCIERIEELYQDNKMLVEKYKEFFTKYYMSNEIARQFKKDIIELEDENIKLKKENGLLKQELNLFKKNDTEHIENDLNINYIEVKKMMLGDEYDSINENLKNNKTNFVNNIKESSEYKELLNKLNIIEKEKKDITEDYIKIQNKSIDIDNDDKFKSLKDDYDKLYYERENNKDEINNYLDDIKTMNDTIKELEDKLKNIPNEEEIENKYKIIYEDKMKQKNKINKTIKENNKSDTFPITEKNDKIANLLKRFPITVYRDINDNEIKDMVASECSYIVKYQYEISNKTNNQNEISINDIVDYIIIQEKLTHQEKNRLLNKYERCYYLHKTYYDKLNIFKFDLSHISVMTKEEWKLWLVELHKLIKNEYPDDVSDNIIVNNCKFIYLRGEKKGQPCNRIECRIKSHKKIH